MQLLESLGVKGRKDELEQAVTEYGCHALALSLLGNLLRIRYQGDVHKRLTLKSLVTTSKNRENQHAFKVMQAYAEYFAGQTELALLSLLGLFDHPIEIEVLRVLWEAQIPELTANIDEGDWWEAIESLRHEYQLLAERVGGEELDCHPLIREYFGKRLEEVQPEVWRQAHARLYEYYKELPEKEFPDTLDEMQPLFHAVAHGCRAELQDAATNIYWKKIHRGSDFYIVKSLGAFNDDLALVAHFFIVPWSKLRGGLSKKAVAFLLNEVGYCLRALGRLKDAVQPMSVALDSWITDKDWRNVSTQASNLSELFLCLGNIDAAIEYGKMSKDCFQHLELEGQTEYFYELMVGCTSLADALCQTGEQVFQEANFLFQEAESLQQQLDPSYPFLYSIRGFLYCDFLITEGKIHEVFIRATQTLEWAKAQKTLLLPTALDQLTLGKILLEANYLDCAVMGLHKSEAQHMLPFGLLSRAHYYRYTQQYPQAYADLKEIYDIAEPSGMRLHMTDYHLEMSRLLIAEGKEPLNKIQEHVDKAEKLINDTGYHRRDKELADLKEQLKVLK